MPKSRIPSPARSQGDAATPKRKNTRGSRSLCSPALSTASGRLTSLVDQFKEKNMESFALSPLNGRSVLNDDTDIQEPRRKSWWKKLNENSQDVMEVLEDNKVTEPNENIEEFIDIEILSQEKKNFTLDLPDSSDNESINSIVLPQRKLFTQRENEPQKKFGQLVGKRETLAKLHKTNTTNIDKIVHVGTRELFQNNKRSKPVFPAALLNMSPNKTAADKTNENLLAEPKPQVRNIFGNRPASKRKNMFADFIVSESEDEIPEIQPKVFEFQKKLEQRQISSISKGRDASPTSSLTTDMEMDDWKLLPSSTLVENQLEDMVAGHTPIKRARLSKLSEAKESEADTNTIQTNSTKQSNKSTSSKNKTRTSPQAKEVLETSRTTRSMTKNTSNSEEESNFSTQTQNAKVNRSQNKTAPKVGKLDISKPEETDKQNSTQNKPQKLNKPQLKNRSKIMVNEVEDDNDAASAIYNATRVISKSAEKLSSSVVASKSQKEINMETDGIEENNSKANNVSNTSIEQNVQGDQDDNNFVLEYENEDQEMAEVIHKSSKENNDKRKTFVKEKDAAVNNKSKVQVANLSQGIIKEQKRTTVEESGESAQDNVDGHSEHEPEEEMELFEYMENNFKESQENLEEQNISNKEINESEEIDSKVNESEANELNESQEVEEGDDSENVDNKVNDSEVNNDDENEHGENDDETEKEIDNKVNESQEIEEEANESQENEAEANESQEIEAEEKESHESEAEENESHEIEEDINESHEIKANETHESEEEEVNESQEIEAEAHDTHESEAEVNESEEIEGEANESHEIEEVEVNESHEIEEDANNTHESEEEVNESHEINEEENEGHETEEEANESHEIEQDEDNGVSESDNEDDNQVDDADESDRAVTSDAEMSEDDNREEIQVDTDGSERASNEAVDGSEQPENDSTHEQAEGQSTDEIEESPNVTHDTTGRNRNKLIKSPEAILQDKTKQMDSFTVKGRNTSVRKTKSMINNLNIRPSLAPPRDSIGFSDGTRNSSAEGSGWDSHRTTRKTLRQTFGKDFTPRKSLRALVMEKSAKRQTEQIDLHCETAKFPQANSTELPEDSNRFVDDVEVSDHEVSRRTRQTTLELYLEKMKQQNIEKKLKMEEAVRNSLKGPVRDTLSLFKVPSKPAPRRPKPTQPKAKKQIKSVIPFDELPSEVIADMKYKPPKRFQPNNASWITKRLYKHLENKLEAKYDYKARVRAEKLVETIYHFAKDLRRHDVAPTDAVDVLKHEMARLDVVSTHFEFYEFFHEFMPREVRVKVVPDIVNKIPLPRHGVFSDILRGNTVQG